MYYRTRTYLAGDWDGDGEAIEKIHEWNEGDKWALSFSDAHKLMQARDSSLNCSIKRSLCERLNTSKRFVLVVGYGTTSRRAGMCCYCHKNGSCIYKVYWREFSSFIEFECDKAAAMYKEGKMEIIVLYNFIHCDKNYCPSVLRSIGKHVAMKEVVDGEVCWDYRAVRYALS